LVPRIPPAEVTVAFVEPRFKVPAVALTLNVAEPLEEPSRITLDTAGFVVKPGAALEPVALPKTV
jgi:hypothetical protein